METSILQSRTALFLPLRLHQRLF